MESSRHGLHVTQSATILERITFNQMDHLHSKYLGTGDADTTAEAFIQNIKKDTIAIILSHQDQLDYQAACLGVHPKRRQIALYRLL